MTGDCWMNSTWIWGFLQFLAVAITLPAIYIQMRIQAASHVVSTLHQINSRWHSSAMLRARKEYCEQWLAGKEEIDGVGETIAEFFEELGTYVRIKAVPKKIFWETYSWYVEYYFKMLRPGIQSVKQRYSDKLLYSEFEWLEREIGKISKRKGAPSLADDEAARALLAVFATAEISSAETLLALKR